MIVWLIVRAFPSWNSTGSHFLLFLDRVGVYRIERSHTRQFMLANMSKFKLSFILAHLCRTALLYNIVDKPMTKMVLQLL